jgi:hypothetical protein
MPAAAMPAAAMLGARRLGRHRADGKDRRGDQGGAHSNAGRPGIRRSVENNFSNGSVHHF